MIKIYVFPLNTDRSILGEAIRLKLTHKIRVRPT